MVLKQKTHIYFVLAGEIEIRDRRGSKAVRIPTASSA